MVEEKDTSWIRTVKLLITPPSLGDNRADVDRLIKAVGNETGSEKMDIDFSLVKELPSKLRELQYDVYVAMYKDLDTWHLIDIFSTEDAVPCYGIAMDIGSTTVVLHLVDLINGEVAYKTSFLNPQIEIGADILTRIHYSSQGNGLEKLHNMLISHLNAEISEVCDKKGISPASVLGLVAAGNTTMTHFFLGLEPRWICREPYIPVVNRPGILTARELSIEINPQAPVLLLPNAGSYFGGDLLAGIVASGMTKKDDISILVDVGTNAEVVLGNKDWLMACAGAAGPALEGGVADAGMLAAPGVIDHVEIDPGSGTFQIGTIDGIKPLGICGSGIIDLIAQLFLTEMLDMRGKFVPAKCGERFRLINDIPHLQIVAPEDSGTGEGLMLSQPDIDALIRSKAAMYTILTTITNMVNISMHDILNFYVAGTFGTYIEPSSAITIGMIPDLPLETYQPLGNSSIKGASMALLSGVVLGEIYAILDKITYIELNVNQEFMNLFSAAKFIPHTNRSLFPSVKV